MHPLFSPHSCVLLFVCVRVCLPRYLEVEWEVRKGNQRSFGKDLMKGSSPRVPQQDNFSDCGVYVLQYVESFFEVQLGKKNKYIYMLRKFTKACHVGRQLCDGQALYSVASSVNVCVFLIFGVLLLVSVDTNQYTKLNLDWYGQTHGNTQTRGRDFSLFEFF